MSFWIIREQWNKLQVTTTLSENIKVTSPEYKIGGAAIVQMSARTYNSNSQIRLTFFKDRPDNDRSYIIKLSSDDESINKNLIGKCCNDTGIWHYIYEGLRAKPWTFTLSITMETVHKMIIFASLFDDSELTDIQLKGEDGNIGFHKAILAGHSPVFMRMLCGKWKEVQEDIIEVPQVRRSTLQQLKEYIYLGKLPDVGLEELLVLASIYMISELEYRLSEVLITKISNENAYEMLEFAIQKGLKKLTVDIIKCSQLGIISGEEMEAIILVGENVNLVEKPINGPN